MSVFAEPLAQARENVDHAEALLTRDPFGEAERGLAATLLREALAAIERAETLHRDDLGFEIACDVCLHAIAEASQAAREDQK